MTHQPPGITRRNLIASAAVIAVAPLPAIAATAPHAAIPEWKNQLEGLRNNPASKNIAARYLHDFPEHRARTALEFALRESLTQHQHAFNVLIQSDFEQHRTLLFDGWPIALTEARLCALLHL